MNEQVLDHAIIATDASPVPTRSDLRSFLPATIAVAGSLLLVAARLTLGGDRFISDGALMMLALASYLIAAVFYLTNFYAPFKLAESLGLWAATIGVFLNLS